MDEGGKLDTFLMLLLIVAAKIVEVSLMTVRMVLITKGERKIGSIIAFFEVAIWVVLVSTVLTDIAKEPLKVVAYALGFALGSFIGSLLEEKIGIGLCEVQVILKSEDGPLVADKLREQGYAVTCVEAHGKNHPRWLLILYVARKKTGQCVKLIKSVQENSVITVSDKKPIYGGFNMIRK